MSDRTYTLDDFAADVNITHPLTARRIPVIGTSHPRWRFHVALVIGEENMSCDSGLEPTDREVDQLCAYLEKHMRYYNDSYRRRVETQAPFDIDGSVVTHIFRKQAENDWQYRKSTFRGGPTWFPTQPWHPIGPLALEDLLDHVNGGDYPSPTWLAVKAESGAFDRVPSGTTETPS